MAASDPAETVVPDYPVVAIASPETDAPLRVGRTLEELAKVVAARTAGG